MKVRKRAKVRPSSSLLTPGKCGTVAMHWCDDLCTLFTLRIAVVAHLNLLAITVTTTTTVTHDRHYHPNQTTDYY